MTVFLRRVCGFLYLALVAASCSVPPLDLVGRECPCTVGWVCDVSANRCVRLPDGSVPDGGVPVSFFEPRSPEGLVASWTFDDDLLDSVGGLAASCSDVGCEQVASDTPDSAQEVRLNGAGALEIAGDAFNFRISNAFTVSVFVRLLPTADSASVLVGNRGATGRGWELRLEDSGALHAVLADSAGGARISRTTVALEPTGWRHVALVWDGTVLRVFVDGMEAAYAGGQADSKVEIRNEEPFPLRVGPLLGTGAGAIDRVDRLRIYRRALTSQDVVRESFLKFAYPERRVGIQYASNQYFPLRALWDIPKGNRLSIEDIIRSPDKSLQDIYHDSGATDAFLKAKKRFFHATPASGFYCLYKARSSDERLSDVYGSLPDCGESTGGAPVETVIEEQALAMWDAGVDFIVVDATKHAYLSWLSDVESLRPIELLAEGLRAVRDRGLPTPQLAVWAPTAPRSAGACRNLSRCDNLSDEADGFGAPCEFEGSNCTERPLLLRSILDELYADPAYEDLIFQHEGRKVVFIADSPEWPAHSEVVQAIEESPYLLGVSMWPTEDVEDAEGGMVVGASCRDGEGAPISVLFGDETCALLSTDSTPIGSVGVVNTTSAPTRAEAPDGVVGQPFGGSGWQEGHVLRRMWMTHVSQPRDYIVVDGWNRNVSAALGPEFLIDVDGLTFLPGASKGGDVSRTADRLRLVEFWGAEHSRMIEPFSASGASAGSAVDDSMLRLLQDCIALYRSGETCATAEGQAHALCCDAAEAPALRLVHSYYSAASPDPYGARHVWFADDESAAEKDALRSGLTQVCIAFRSSLPAADAGRPSPPLCIQGEPRADGPFFTFVEPAEARQPLHRCRDQVGNYALGSPSCPPGFSEDVLLGYIAENRSSAAPRPLRRCLRTGQYFHWLSDRPCPSGSVQNDLGFVR